MLQPIPVSPGWQAVLQPGEVGDAISSHPETIENLQTTWCACLSLYTELALCAMLYLRDVCKLRNWPLRKFQNWAAVRNMRCTIRTFKCEVATIWHHTRRHDDCQWLSPDQSVVGGIQESEASRRKKKFEKTCASLEGGYVVRNESLNQ